MDQFYDAIKRSDFEIQNRAQRIIIAAPEQNENPHFHPNWTESRETSGEPSSSPTAAHALDVLTP